jgi:hypothetical protein
MCDHFRHQLKFGAILVNFLMEIRVFTPRFNRCDHILERFLKQVSQMKYKAFSP